jgi:glucokinase
MNTLAIDIGGTKFTLAAFEGARMVRRESRSTDVEGGRDWMLAQLGEIASAWQAEQEFQTCGIGFGGPVDYRAQRIALSTHVGGWQEFGLSAWVRDKFDVPTVMDT